MNLPPATQQPWLNVIHAAAQHPRCECLAVGGGMTVLWWLLWAEAGVAVDPQHSCFCIVADLLLFTDQPMVCQHQERPASCACR